MTQRTLTHDEWIIELAVTYHGFHRCLDSNDQNGLFVWGEQMLEAQKALRLDFLNTANIQMIIDHADRRLKEQKNERT